MGTCVIVRLCEAVSLRGRNRWHVVRCWPAGPVRGPSVPFCGRYDAIDKSPPTFTHIARATDNFCEIELRAYSARNRLLHIQSPSSECRLER
eukprot:scaffold4827_cov194-Skeletonema_marinoi.AAC.2